MKTLVIFSVIATSCATLGGQSLKNCELNQLSNVEQVAAGCAMSALVDPGDWRSEVLKCGEGLLPAQVNCVMAAIVTAAESGNVPKVSPIVIRGRQWLNEHAVRLPICR